MSEFDDLLNEVLDLEGSAEPPLGMEQRIASRLAALAKRLPRRRRIWVEAVAAVLVFGFGTTWILVYSRPSLKVATSGDPVSVMVSVDARELADGGNATLTPVAQLEKDRKGSTVASRATPYERFARINAARVVPLAIESLAVQPIEVASLNSATANPKGELR